jgi:hypothetical protein
MPSAWQEYQEQCAAVFRSLGLDAEVDKKVSGARGAHAVDVYVSTTLFGLKMRWIVECKDWKSNIPKEKVLALLAIVQDTGADKGILLSEVGFQSGAIQAVRGTNVVLASISDLKEAIQNDFRESIVSKLSWRLTRVTERLRALDRDAEDYVWTPQLELQRKLFVLDLSFQEALKGEFPIIYAIGRGDERLKAPDFDTLVSESDKLLREAEEHCTLEEDKRRIGFI